MSPFKFSCQEENIIYVVVGLKSYLPNHGHSLIKPASFPLDLPYVCLHTSPAPLHCYSMLACNRGHVPQAPFTLPSQGGNHVPVLCIAFFMKKRHRCEWESQKMGVSDGVHSLTAEQILHSSN